MIRVDLITGFLGAGKTTFLLRYAGYLTGCGLKIGILAYDHGAMNVDMPLLRELRGPLCEIEMLAAACDDDCLRRRFRTRLLSMSVAGYDRILVEPSGVFDMDEFFDTLSEAPLDRLLVPGSVIAVVDALLDDSLPEEDDFFLASQAACAGRIVLSRVQLASEEDIRRTVLHLRRAGEAIQSRGDTEDRILARDWDLLRPEDFETLMNCGFRGADYVKTIAGRPSAFQSLSFLGLPLDRQGLEEKVTQLFSGRHFGRILRVKGFFREDGVKFQINATEKDRNIETCREDPCVADGSSEHSCDVIVIGSGLCEDEISLLMTGQLPEHRIL